MNRDRIFWIVAVAILVAYFMLRGDILSFGITIIALLIAVTVHECAHAWTADYLGDPTARLLGRVSLNPLVHLDPLGTVMMLITALTGFGIGWGKPVPVTPYRLRYGARRGTALVALSGPASNLAAAILLGLVARFVQGVAGPQGVWLYRVLQIIVLTNIVIAMFNLLPLPPLDGHSVLIGLLSFSRSRWAWQATEFIYSLQRYGPMLLFGLILISQFFGFNLIGRLIGGPSFLIFRAIMGRLV
ncbi:MAG: site-2 protease family protein [Chloroflexi bacterium]|nr:site-2 protease family protein [Chloroflexota bacterium]